MFKGFDLAQHLAERTRIVKSAPFRRQGEFVLYWMHHAVRSRENPALDTAAALADQLDVPLLVYQGLGGRHPYNSDRHHTFIMEGAREAHQGLKQKHIRHVFHLPQKPADRTPLRQLAGRAALVVTEDFPAPPFRQWSRQLAGAVEPPVWAVDCACIIPMQSIRKSHARAYQFRDHTWTEFQWRVRLEWVESRVEPPWFDGDPGFEALEFKNADFAALCARCEIDHGIGPVPHTVGGSKAGYARWEAFKQNGLKHYARLRNDAAVLFPRGVSRMSPYLHHGHVSPFRIAREAAQAGHPGAEKFLDELLIWRELAHNFCFHHDPIESLAVLPGWARQTLEFHAADPRPSIYSQEQLARGVSGDALWDAAQRSLLIHGELHNNVRMTWGKAFLQWTRNPEEALRLMIDLNHRYALDGSDPNSYGGLLWCLGLFDRPFKPEKPVIGSLRPRPTKDHARRLNMSKYLDKVKGPVTGRPLAIAVIGAGLSGLTAARILSDNGHDVRVYEKSRGSGGRMATRREGDLRFDHGAQYFTVRDERFRRSVDSWQEQGLVKRWQGVMASLPEPATIRIKNPSIQRFVGVPGMNAIARHLADAVRPRYRTPVGAVTFRGGRWQLSDTAGKPIDTSDILIVATPAPQASALLEAETEVARTVQTIHMLPCWAVLAAFEKPLETGFDGGFFQKAPIAWASRNSSKPKRPHPESWILHADNRWSEAHAGEAPQKVVETLIDAFFVHTGIEAVEPVFAKAHFWRYAIAENPLEEGYLWDPVKKVGVCGDWCRLSRVEGAFLSGMAVAGRILGALARADRQLTLE
jgi:photolyase PhrII